MKIWWSYYDHFITWICAEPLQLRYKKKETPSYRTPTFLMHHLVSDWMSLWTHENMNMMVGRCVVRGMPKQCSFDVWCTYKCESYREGTTYESCPSLPFSSFHFTFPFLWKYFCRRLLLDRYLYEAWYEKKKDLFISLLFFQPSFLLPSCIKMIFS